MKSPRKKRGQGREFVIHTSQEMDILQRATADGKHGRNYKSNPQSGTIVYETEDLPHRLTLSEQYAGVPMEALEKLARAQDADSALAMLYIASLLAPPGPTGPNELHAGWVDFDDVIDKIGWDPRSTGERIEMRKRIWTFIEFVERAVVAGRRREEYYDRTLKKHIETEISSPLWRVMDRREPVQPELPGMDSPLEVQIVISKEWATLLTSPQTTQYLPLGEVLGAIKGNKPSGAWARVIGLALANFWRRNARRMTSKDIHPTRRELLERFTPKTGPVSEVLEGVNAGRAIEYWCGALKTLVESGFLAPEGEAAVTAKQMRESLPHRDWAAAWLDESVHLVPGPLMAENVAHVAHGKLTEDKKDIKKVAP